MSTDARSCFCGGCSSCMIWQKNKEIAELQYTVKALKIDISHRSEITLLLQQKYEAAFLQINELQKIVDAAVELVEWHGAGAVKSERYDRLFSLAGNYHLKAAEKRKCACRCHVGGDGAMTACGCCSYPT